MSKILSIFPIPAFQDNYIWLIDTNEGYIVVDPGDANPVIDKLGKSINKDLTILITHHHFDHTGGVEKLRNQYNAKVIGPHYSPFKDLDIAVKAGDSLVVYDLNIEVNEVPGHTLDHIFFLISEGKQLHLFCGDTLFSGGCGRVFEGTFEQMHASLCKIKSLPEYTLVYPTHEYTLSNLSFALTVEPNNSDLSTYEKHCKNLRKQEIPTLPTSIGQEILINPFLRDDSIEIKTNLERVQRMECSSPVDVFSGLRKWKDSF
jgi:hydroxyacylglutathione hydrolase